MLNRAFVAALAIPALAACSSKPDAPPPPSFTSDRISVVTRGTGPDIVLVHGLAANADVWSAVADSLDETYRLHIVQINGFGGAPPGANTDSIILAPVAEEVARYAGALQRPAIIGHSLGGSIAMMVAARHPDVVSRVMTVDGPPFLGAAFLPPNAGPEAVRAAADGARGAITSSLSTGKPGMLEQMVATMARDSASIRMLLDHARASDRQAVGNAMHEGIMLDLRPELSRISVPLTALYVIPPNVPLKPAQFDSMVVRAFANARGARLVRIDSSLHYIQLDQPGRFVTEVRAFMAR